ncbi:DNA-binding transcriptional regulator ModE [Aliarcobacter thereius]|uniref:DNA-binding transcriptional regulator ModE n=2 Tax=Aliarcobacter thereius TaxID=544718 RepID=A0A1C0BA32_9BACT|nr:TOBE domain-containing protein [Aliarcobacter thereius]OCL88402.1 DNA-binding transcriptional regulator ModE [Aliarcobacter thereius]OCL91892.1 DNA-binding transcriptional regulator ModE [Aliarcobacter thereius]OCL95010.1 DNA-binding transcriptional regulator ModE [Aliarcobacter thereius LMG 24486]OCM00458.1 DNA-binding transcriptional regulator ModE [Aliarcobacter thereius]QBF15119.1 molybdenum-pterin binding domain-containing protein [Aliarcobacter thereius LMG 24486]
MIARVKNIHSSDSLNIIEFDFYNNIFKMMSLDLIENLQVGSKVELLVKPTNISISKKHIEDISLSNQALAKIISINSGELLSNIILEINSTKLESIITKNSKERLNLKENDEVNILIKASDLSIYRILND